MSTSEDSSGIPTHARVRATSSTHPDHNKLTTLQRQEIAIMVAMGSVKEHLAQEYGVSRKTVMNCYRRYFDA